MNISEVIVELEKYKNKHGDLRVVMVEDDNKVADYEPYEMSIGVVNNYDRLFSYITSEPNVLVLRS